MYVCLCMSVYVYIYVAPLNVNGAEGKDAGCWEICIYFFDCFYVVLWSNG